MGFTASKANSSMIHACITPRLSVTIPPSCIVAGGVVITTSIEGDAGV
jgi:hypothetical protein